MYIMKYVKLFENFVNENITIKSENVPENIYEILYKLDRRFVDSDLIVNKTEDETFKIYSEKIFTPLHIEGGEDMGSENDVWEWLNGLYVDKN